MTETVNNAMRTMRLRDAMRVAFSEGGHRLLICGALLWWFASFDALPNDPLATKLIFGFRVLGVLCFVSPFLAALILWIAVRIRATREGR